MYLYTCRGDKTGTAETFPQARNSAKMGVSMEKDANRNRIEQKAVPIGAAFDGTFDVLLSLISLITHPTT